MKKYGLSFFLSLVLYLVTAPLRGGYVTVLGLTGLPLSTLVGFILYFLFTFFLLHKFEGKTKKYVVLLAILLGCILLELPVRILRFQSSLGSLPDIVFKIVAISAAFLFYTVKGYFQKLTVSFPVFILCLWFSFEGYSSWIHKLNFGTFTGVTEQVIGSPVVFRNSEEMDISLNDFRGKYVLLDFWSSTCGVCFQKFPKVQELYDEIRGKQNIELYSIFCHISKKGENSETAEDILQKRGFSFPSLSIDINEPVLKEIGVDGFPTVVICDPNGKIVFRGNIEKAREYLKNQLASLN